jgi:hypothetical protein
MTIKQQGGIFGRNPTFNDVDVEGTLTVDGNAVPDAGTILVDSDIGVTVQGYDADTAKRDTAQTFTAKQDFIFAGGGNYVAQFQNTTAATPYAVSIKDAASSSNGYPLLIISNSAGSDTYFRVDSGTSDITAGKNIRFLSSGLGIDFSATSGTGTSELFDDYEEGTFTPVVADAASGGNEASASASNGYYTKVGRSVTVTIDLQNINTTGLTSGNNIFITGLPFSAGSLTGNINYTGSVNGGGTLSSAKSVIAVVYDNVSYIRLVEATSTSVTGWLDVSEINSGATDFRFSVTYFT